MLSEAVPFNERGGRLRGVLDAVSGRFPTFVFGGSVGNDLLPVFHFHDESHEDLEPKLRYLAENGYRSVTNDEIVRFVDGKLAGGSRLVALCFDDVWASVWTVAAPLLKQYGLTAIAYAIPARIEDAAACRPSSERVAADGPPFATWPELRALHGSGVVDIQCHTYSHSRIFCSGTVAGYVTPAFESTPLLNRPQIADSPSLRFLTPTDLGAPLFPTRSRMSDGSRVSVDPAVHENCQAHVARGGGPAYFTRPSWRSELDAIARDVKPQRESPAARQKAIEEELDRGRAVLSDRLKTKTVNHVCLPWGVSSDATAAALHRLGFASAFANRLRGIHAVRRGDDRYWLKRLPNKYIFRLPGRGRRLWSVKASAERAL
ncbi:MAG TPA: polysaccharide deacetylase family protein [Vicinamibacterales bacterium]